MVISQLIALEIGEILQKSVIWDFIVNIITSIIYVFLCLLGVKILCEKYLKLSLSKIRVVKIPPKVTWIISAFLCPCIVIFIFVLSGGYMIVNNFDNEALFSLFSEAVFYYGFAVGIVEEVIFRGVTMSILEKRFNTKIAVIIPSVLFGLLHIIGNNLDFISIIQLVIAGSIVGILFSLITYESGSIINSAIFHGVWNMALVGGILHIGKNTDNNSIYSFVLENKSFLVTGGDFGIEASVISIFAYLIFVFFALYKISKNRNLN